MLNSLKLFKSEMVRLYKYKILTISLALSGIWMAILFFIGEESAGVFVGLFIALDASIMSIIMLGASLFFEREENTLKPLLVTPLSVGQIIGVKILTGITVALQSAILVSLFVTFILGLSVNFIALILLVSLIALVHSVIGFFFAMQARDFTGLLVYIIIYSLVFALPSLLVALDVISGWVENLLLISPIQDALLYMNMVFGVDTTLTYTSFSFIFSVGFLLSLSFLLYRGYIKPNYPTAAVKE